MKNDSHTQATSPLPEAPLLPAPLRLPLAPATCVASRRRAILKIARKWGRVDDMTGSRKGWRRPPRNIVLELLTGYSFPTPPASVKI